jgi:hypothetical protein
MACPGGHNEEDETDLRAEAEEAIRAYVWGGEHDPEEVRTIVGEEIFVDDEEQEEWIEATVRRAFVEKRKAERSWPKVTDCDRLDRAFEALEKRGIIADHDAGFTQSDGIDTVDELYRDAGGKKSPFVGYCFYTSQDLEGAIAGGGLMLAYGHFTDHEKKGVEIGRLLREELERAGFTVEWDGAVRTRILLKGFRWQKRSPR